MSPVRPPFLAFDDRKAVRIYNRNLPHWRQEGATYFVTFRLGDSVPQGVLEQWEYEKQLWLAARGVQTNGKGWPRQISRLPQHEQAQFHKHFNRLFHLQLDQCHGACHLNTLRCRSAVRLKLLEGDAKIYHLGDFVIMPNHVHLLLNPLPGFELETQLKRIKGASVRECNLILQRRGQLWQPDSYDHIVRSLEQLVRFRDYVTGNPEKAGIILPEEAHYRADWMDEWLL